MLGSSIDIQTNAYEIATMLISQWVPEEFTTLAVCQLSDTLDRVSEISHWNDIFLKIRKSYA